MALHYTLECHATHGLLNTLNMFGNTGTCTNKPILHATSAGCAHAVGEWLARILSEFHCYRCNIVCCLFVMQSLKTPPLEGMLARLCYAC
jgi:hypothetical protein